MCQSIPTIISHIAQPLIKYQANNLTRAPEKECYSLLGFYLFLPGLDVGRLACLETVFLVMPHIGLASMGLLRFIDPLILKLDDSNTLNGHISRLNHVLKRSQLEPSKVSTRFLSLLG